VFAVANIKTLKICKAENNFINLLQAGFDSLKRYWGWQARQKKTQRLGTAIKID